MSNLPLTKSWQQRKIARHCTNPMKKKQYCQYWALPTALPPNRDCLLKLQVLVKSTRTVSQESYLEKYLH